MAGWSAADFEQLRAEQGAEVQYLDLLPGKPPLGIDCRGMLDLAAEGKIGGPVAARVFEAFGQGQDGDQAADPDPAVQARVLDQLKAQADWDDMILAAIVVDPPYCPFAEMPPDGSRPPGQLCYRDFPAEVRRKVVRIPFEGVDALNTFRPEPAGAAGVRDGGGLRDAAEQPDLSDPAEPSAVLAGRGGLVAGGPGGDDAPPAPHDARLGRAWLEHAYPRNGQ